MKCVLITGMSGTGKSTVIKELALQGYKAVDMDEPGWSETRSDGEWVWREDQTAELLATADAEVLFVGGCASNQIKFYPRFDGIILLSAPVDTIKERLATRTSNPFGKRPEELERILHDLQVTEPKLRHAATREIVTDVGITEVVQDVLAEVRHWKA